MSLCKRYEALIATYAVTYSSSILFLFTHRVVYQLLQGNNNASFIPLAGWLVYALFIAVALKFRFQVLLLILTGFTSVAIPVVSFYHWRPDAIFLVAENPVIYCLLLIVNIPITGLFLIWLNNLKGWKLGSSPVKFYLVGGIVGGCVCGALFFIFSLLVMWIVAILAPGAVYLHWN
jgi:hypothetical protein